MSPRGRKYVVNSTGPNTEPCGTPHFNFVMLDCTFLIATCWVRPFKQDSNQLRAVPVIPIREFNTASNRSWSTVSKSALKSNRTKITDFFFSSEALMMSLCTRTRAVSTLCPSLYADWNISAKLHYSDVTMSAMSSQITGNTILYSTIFSGADQRKHQSSASLAFVWWIHRWPVNSPHKGPVTGISFHLMTSSGVENKYMVEKICKQYLCFNK